MIKSDEWGRIYSIFDEKDEWVDTRKRHYETSFGKELTMEELKEKILEAL